MIPSAVAATATGVAAYRVAATTTTLRQTARSRVRTTRTTTTTTTTRRSSTSTSSTSSGSSGAKPSSSSSSPFSAQNGRVILTHIGVGMGAASFWRGAWYILDDHMFPDDPPMSAITSFVLGCAGMTLSQGLVGRLDQLEKQFKQKSKSSSMLGGLLSSPQRFRKYVLPVKVARFGALYTIAMSCVLVWRGTWLGWDVLYEYTHPHNTSLLLTDRERDQNHHHHDHSHAHHHHHVGIEHMHHHQQQLHEHHHQQQPKQQEQQQHPPLQRINSTDPGHATMSGVLSHVVAVAVLCGTGLFASVLAPPAATSVVRDFTVKAVKSSSTSSTSAAFGTGTSYTGPAQQLVSKLFGGGNSGAASSSSSSSNGAATTTAAAFHHSSSLSSSSTTTASHHRAASYASPAATSSPTVIARSPQFRTNRPPVMSRHNDLNRTATSIH